MERLFVYVFIYFRNARISLNYYYYYQNGLHKKRTFG